MKADEQITDAVLPLPFFKGRYIINPQKNEVRTMTLDVKPVKNPRTITGITDKKEKKESFTENVLAHIVEMASKRKMLKGKGVRVPKIIISEVMIKCKNREGFGTRGSV